MRPKVCRTLVELEKIVADGLDVLIADGSLAQRHFEGRIVDSCADVVMAITSMEPMPSSGACPGKAIQAVLGYFRFGQVSILPG